MNFARIDAEQADAFAVDAEGVTVHNSDSGQQCQNDHFFPASSKQLHAVEVQIATDQEALGSRRQREHCHNPCSLRPGAGVKNSSLLAVTVGLTWYMSEFIAMASATTANGIFTPVDMCDPDDIFRRAESNGN